MVVGVIVLLVLWYINGAPLCARVAALLLPCAEREFPALLVVLAYQEKKLIVFWKRHFSRVSAKKTHWGVFFVFWGCFCAVGGCFCAFWVFFFLFARQRDFFCGWVNFLGLPHRNGEFPLCPCERTWLEQPHGRHHKAPPLPCALATTTNQTK